MIEQSSPLAKACSTTVRLVDQQGQPLAKVDIRVTNCVDRQGKHYRTAGKHKYTSDENGEIVLQDIPEGKIKLASWTRAYYYNPVLNEHDTDENPIVLKLQQTGSLMVKVVDSQGNPVVARYNVSIEPEGGGGVGSWGGSGNIRKDGTMIFHNIPPGRYNVTGKPNPGPVNKTSKPILVEIKGKDRYTVEIVAR